MQFSGMGAPSSLVVVPTPRVVAVLIATWQAAYSSTFASKARTRRMSIRAGVRMKCEGTRGGHLFQDHVVTCSMRDHRSQWPGRVRHLTAVLLARMPGFPSTVVRCVTLTGPTYSQNP